MQHDETWGSAFSRYWHRGPNTTSLFDPTPHLGEARHEKRNETDDRNVHDPQLAGSDVRCRQIIRPHRTERLSDGPSYGHYRPRSSAAIGPAFSTAH